MMLPRFVLSCFLLSLIAGSAYAEEGPERHRAISLIGTPKYPADFKHFDYVNPDAPKGGFVRMANIGSFDSLNPILYKGEAAAGLGRGGDPVPRPSPRDGQAREVDDRATERAVCV